MPRKATKTSTLQTTTATAGILFKSLSTEVVTKMADGIVEADLAGRAEVHKAEKTALMKMVRVTRTIGVKIDVDDWKDRMADIVRSNLTARREAGLMAMTDNALKSALKRTKAATISLTNADWSGVLETLVDGMTTDAEVAALRRELIPLGLRKENGTFDPDATDPGETLADYIARVRPITAKLGCWPQDSGSSGNSGGSGGTSDTEQDAGESVNLTGASPHRLAVALAQGSEELARAFESIAGADDAVKAAFLRMYKHEIKPLLKA